MLEKSPQTPHFIGRKPEISWLERGAQLGNVMLLKGLRGVGKSTLVQKWLSSRSAHSLWFNLENFHSLSHILGFPDLSSELALQASEKNWSGYSVVIWRDLHLLPPSQRQILLSFLCRRSSSPIQILLSEEEIAEADRIEISQLKISAFPKEESKAFLESFDPGISAQQIELIHQASGGLPLLLRLAAQNPHYSPKEVLSGRILHDLPVELRITLESLAVYNHAIAENQIIDCNSVPEVWRELNRKCLLDKIPGEVANYKLPAYVRNMIWNSLLPTQRMATAQKVFQWPIAKTLPAIDLLRLALISQNTSNLNLNNNFAAELEQLHRDDQKEIFQLLLDFPIRDLDADQKIDRERYLAKLQFLMGNRKEALLRAQSEAEKILQNNQNSISAQNLILEYVQLLNRSGENSKARALAQSTLETLRDDLRALITVEQAVSWLPQDPSTAANILNKILNSPQLPILAKANAHFQMGRAYDLKQENAKAKHEYAQALQIFTAQNRTYHSLVCRLNIAWLCLKDRDWPALQIQKNTLHEAAHIFGYDYAIAGLEIIEAAEAREFLQFNKSLLKADSAIRRLGNNAPAGNLFDAYAEKVRALLALQMRDLAKSVVDGLKALPQFKKIELKISDLQWLAQQSNFKFEEWQESKNLNDPSYWHDDILIQSAHLGLDDGKIAETISPLFQLVAIENSLLSQLQENDLDQIWSSIRKMEKILDTTTEPMLERVANLLLQYRLTAASVQRQLLLERASLELQRFNGDAESKYPLQAWLDSPDGNPSDHPLWKKSQPGDRERWILWRSIPSQQKSDWLLYTNSGRTEVASLPENTGTEELYFHAPLAELRWRGKNLSQLQRRHSLRQLLTCLLENCPEAVSKEELARTVWQEEYNPAAHDARIYTSMQRLRNLFKKPDCIQNWQGSYRWNPSLTFLLIQKNSSQSGRETKLQTLILQALKSSTEPCSRSDLVAITKSPEATVKRSLSILLEQGKIRRLGKGRSICYRIAS